MSNYSDFFGVGSTSSGGGGLPVNSYNPFFTIGTTNPPGYDATTGLYTHPDGTIWLETGNTIVDTSTTYPDATSTFSGAQINSIAMPYFGSGGTRMTTQYDATYIAATDKMFSRGVDVSNVGDQLQVWDMNGTVATGNFVPTQDVKVALKATNDSGGLSRNAAGNLVAADGVGGSTPLTLTEYTQAGVATGTTYTAVSGNDIRYMDYNSSTNTFYGVDTTAGVVNEFSSDFTSIVRTWSYTSETPTATDVKGIAFDGNFIYLRSSPLGNNTFFQYTTSGVYTSFSFNTSLSGGNQSAAIGWTAGFISHFANNANAHRLSQITQTFGDGTARTDTDSSQPLFVRLK